jgi:Tetrapyrrole (Corrin/Porphyrin) Methylases
VSAAAAAGEPAGRSRSGGGRLTVVGTGYLVAGQVTPEAAAAMAAAQRLFYLVSDPATAAWLRQLNPAARSLHDCYRPGADGRAACERMVERILAPLARGLAVCAAFYGHPAVFLHPSHEALRRARERGFAARMLPAVSAEDCLFADLGVDPGVAGRSLFEATDFLLRRRVFDPRSALVLLQVGAIGLTEYREGVEPNRHGLGLLAAALGRHYPRGHRAILYQAPQLPLFDPMARSVALDDLAAAPLTVFSTLYVPPLGDPRGEPPPA